MLNANYRFCSYITELYKLGRGCFEGWAALPNMVLTFSHSFTLNKIILFIVIFNKTLKDRPLSVF